MGQQKPLAKTRTGLKKKKNTVPLNKKLRLKKKIHQAAHLESSAIRLKTNKQKTPKKHFKWKLPEQGTQNVPIVRVKLIVCK